MVERVLKTLTSLRLTVVCLAFALVLVIVGTVAQVNEGLYQAQTRYFRSFFVWWSLPGSPGWQLPILPGGYLLGTMLLVNLIAAHVKRFGLTRKKLGILMIHSGLILLLLGQLLTDMLSEWSTMPLLRGQTLNYSEDSLLHELVVIDKSDPAYDKVVAVPDTLLARKADVPHAQVPFTIRVKEFWPNASLSLLPEAGALKVATTQGVGTNHVFVLPQPLVVDPDLRNSPAAEVEILGPAGSIGTWLVSTLVKPLQRFIYANRQYELALRVKRHYMPFALTLLELHHDVYKGSDIPRNFSSRVRIWNPQTREDREVWIYMNNPLRYQGETFYQHQMEQASNRSVLQVVRNPAWLSPYFSCVLMGLGLVVQFVTHLVGFVRKPRTQSISRPAPQSEPGPGFRFRPAYLVPLGIFAVFLLYVVEAMFRPVRSPEGFDLAAFGRLPVLMNGRVQPIDSVARNSLLQIRSTTTVPLAENGSPKLKLKPTEWLLEVMTRPDLADTRRIFLVHHPELLGELNLRTTPGSGLNYYAFNELASKLDEIERQARRIDGTKPENRSASERQLLKLQNALLIYQRLKNSLQPNKHLQVQGPGKRPEFDFAARLAGYEAVLPAAGSAATARRLGEAHNPIPYDAARAFLEPFELVSRAALPLLIPKPSASKSANAWENIGVALLESLQTGQVPRPVSFFAAISSGFAYGKPEAFNAAATDYHQWLKGQGLERELTKGAREFFFNKWQPFVKATAIYLVSFLLGCTFWFKRSLLLYRSAVLLVGLAFVLHTTGLLFRIFLEGRPPVTNLYSSAIFVGWGAAFLGLAVEWFYRNGLGLATAAFVGFVTQIIAHNLALGGDTMEMMRAVLDNNFWLATHVVVITLGYSSMFVAGFVAAAYLFLGVLTRRLTPDAAQSLDRVVYGIVCFATLFSFCGTVLGGIWADQSWGRFWGWDPKENGALLIVLWNALWLHVRWGRLGGQQTLMALAVGGNIITSLSWFGVNMLGVGLHSYGFIDAAFRWLMLFGASQLVLILLGFLPLRFWRNFRLDRATVQPLRVTKSPERSRPKGRRPAPAATCSSGHHW